MNQQYVLKNGNEITIVPLTADHLADILTLQKKVIATLTTESFLQPLSVEEFLFILKGRGLMIGAYDHERLIAFRAMLEPDLDEEHLGKDAGLHESEWPLVLYSEITIVDPDFRGNNLQVLLGEIIIQEIDEQKFRYICTTVAPFNIASLKDKFTHGLKIVALKAKYGNLLRYILMKDLLCQLEDNEASENHEILMGNTEEQQRYLHEGWKGTAIIELDNQWFVRFEK